jgi:hypothetical protein
MKRIESLALKGDLDAIGALLDMREDKLQNFKNLQQTILVFRELEALI